MTTHSFESNAWQEGPFTEIMMPIDVAAHIEKLIFLHDTLVLPSFGAFVAKRRNAQIDPVSGTLMPPARTLTFDDAILSDDGVLVDDIARSHHLDRSEAAEALHAWISDVEKRLNRREIVTLPGVGRMYKNYVQRVQFLPDSNNFNTETFGLPPIQFAPLGDTREVTDKMSVETKTANGSVTAIKPHRNTWIGTAAALLLLLGVGVIGIMWWQHQTYKPEQTGATVPLTNGKETEPDLPEMEAAETDREMQPPVKLTDDETTPATVQEPTNAESAPKSQNARQPIVNKPPRSKGRECILVVATLQDENNAERLKTILRDNGYDLFYLLKNGHQVGVRFHYNDLSQVQQTIFDLQKLTGERDIWIKQK